MAVQCASTRRSAPDSTAVLDLASRLRGGLIQPGDPAFDETRRAFHGGYGRRPALIVRAVDVIDVIRAVNFARENDLTLAIRSG